MREKLEEACGLEVALAVVGGKWKPLVLYEMKSGPVRFGELRRRVGGVSEKMLIQSLRELERDGMVHREIFHQVPPRVEYSMTELGRSLSDVLDPLCHWGEENRERIVSGGSNRRVQAAGTP